MAERTLGRYRITGELGRGGMGVVYRATDARLGREVALKVLTAGPKSDPEMDARLRREAKAAAALTHPAICVIYEIDEAEGATSSRWSSCGPPLASLVRPGMEPAALGAAAEVAKAWPKPTAAASSIAT
jgi:serine/threonine protein kinase